MEIFWRLVLGHLIADFTLQTNYIAAWKRRSVWGLLVHCGIHPIIYSILLWRYVGQVWIQAGPLKLTGCTCILLVFITHLIEDEWRIWSVLKRNAPDNTFFYVWDQIIHYAIIFALSPVVDGAVSKFGFIYFPEIMGVVPGAQAAQMSLIERFFTITRPENWIFVAILFVIITHFTTVTIYFLEKDFLGRDFPDVPEKYTTMAERLIVMACLLLPGMWWISVLGVWALRAFIYKARRIYDYTWMNILIGNGAAVVCGFLARLLIRV